MKKDSLVIPMPSELFAPAESSFFDGVYDPGEFSFGPETSRALEPLTWNATRAKPFGRSRLKKPIRSLIQGYVRTLANATIALEFSTAPQKYLLGVTDDQYEAVTSDKFRAYVGSLIAATQNPETGQNPEFGQLPQGTLEPHIQLFIDELLNNRMPLTE